MQNSETLISIEAMHTGSTLSINQSKQDFDIPNQSTDFISTSNSLSSTNNDPHTNNVSSVVSILKDTLERKKHVNNNEKLRTTIQIPTKCMDFILMILF